MASHESTPLVKNGPVVLSADTHNAKSMSSGLTNLILGINIVFAIFIGRYATYEDASEYTADQYMVFRDIMVMLLLGFGYLMTFLHKYGMGAVGMTMLLTVLNMQSNIMIEGMLSADSLPIKIGMESMINAEFSAAALLITFGAIIGRATPSQMCMVAVAESFFYAINKIVIVSRALGAEDVGGTITIHMFGAYFGLACAGALGKQVKPSAELNGSSHVSDVFAFIGTTLLWVYWPSFVGATETASATYESRCIIHTILALLGSTCAAFYMSAKFCEGKFDPVHIQNSVLAGGVAVGSSARLAMTPAGAFIVGLVAGVVSVSGYVYSSQFLESKIGIFDTCGVGNLHGYPSIVGGLASAIFVAIDSDAEFLTYGKGAQSIRQIAAVFATLVFSKFFGYFSGLIIFKHFETPDYHDSVWWVGEYFD